MNSVTTRRFRDALAGLPTEVRRQAMEAYRRFRNNPHHPGLQFKRVHATEPVYSVRINIDYRALGVRRDDAIVWFWIGSHAEYDRLLKVL